MLLARLAAAGLPGERLEWSEVLCDGPVPAVDGEAFRSVRAAWLADHTLDPLAAPSLAVVLREQDEALTAAAERDELVLWIGNEWFCQANALALIARLGPMGARMSWVVADDDPEHPGCSVGELADEALPQAFAARTPIDAAAIAVAVLAWDAYRAPHPAALQALVDEAAAFAAWPALRAALALHLSEWPDANDGLARSERQLLSALTRGPRDVAGLMSACAQAESRPWLTDLLIVSRLRRLAAGEVPLVTLTGESPQTLTAALTEAGREVLAGRARWSTPDRWLGGARIGATSPWVRDAATGRVVTRA